MNRFPNVSLLVLSAFYVLGDEITTHLLLVDSELVERMDSLIGTLLVASVTRAIDAPGVTRTSETSPPRRRPRRGVLMEMRSKYGAVPTETSIRFVSSIQNT